MNNTTILVLASAAILFLIFIVLFIVWERVQVELEGHTLILKYPLSNKKIDLDKELVSWKVQEAYYIRLGMIYSINMLFRDGKRVQVNSRLNQENFDRLYEHLETHYVGRKAKD